MSEGWIVLDALVVERQGEDIDMFHPETTARWLVGQDLRIVARTHEGDRYDLHNVEVDPYPPPIPPPIEKCSACGWHGQLAPNGMCWSCVYEDLYDTGGVV